MLSNPIQLSLLLALAINLTISDRAQGQAEPTPIQPDQTLITFYAMGDVPYAPQEDVLLRQQLADLPSDGQFVIHVGDIKAGSSPCDTAVYTKVASILSASRTPLLIIPGDNEWNDCVDPEQAWQLWVQNFMRFEQRWPHGLPLFRQLEREENFSFVKDNVLFIGINIVGGRVHDPQEWKQRHAEDLAWVRRNLARFAKDVSSLVIFGHANPTNNHDDFFVAFSQDAQKFQKPILYLHGDGHKWLRDRPFPAKNILRVQVDQGGIAPPVKVSVTTHQTEPFQFDRRLTPAAGP